MVQKRNGREPTSTPSTQSVRRQPVSQHKSPLLLQRAQADPASLTPADVKVLQRTVGNRATRSLLRPLLQQQNMRLGPVDDPLEREADEAAEEVVRRNRKEGALADGEAQGVPITSQRKSVPNQTARRLAQATYDSNGGSIDQSVQAQIQRARSRGITLDGSVRRRMEAGFNQDFSNVRIHTDAAADRLNRTFNARAFTSENDIFFQKGAFDTESGKGQRLLAHELTHVVQQRGPGAAVQRSPSGLVQRNGFKKLKKSDDPDTVMHKALGKQLVATYRIIDQVGDALQKGKNKEALKSAAIGVAKAGLTLATMFSGIPGLTAGTDAFAGDVVLNLGPETLAQETVSKGGSTGLGLAETETVSQDLTRGIKDTTTGGYVKGKIHDKVGTLSNAANTLLGFIPFFDAAKAVGKGIKTGATSKDDWNRAKGKLVMGVSDIIAYTRECLQEVDNNFDDIEIVSANSTLAFRHTRRTLAQVIAKYEEKADALITTINAFTTKHEDVTPLLTLDLADPLD